MMKQKWAYLGKLSFIGILVLMLGGCGFHLRHTHMHMLTHYPVLVLPPSGSITFYQALKRAFLAQSVEIAETISPDNPLPTLVVTNEQMSQFPLVYGPDGELRRERLKLVISFSFGPPQNNFTLMTQRDRQLNSKQHLGDNAEKILIEQEMQADIINQLFRYLDQL